MQVGRFVALLVAAGVGCSSVDAGAGEAARSAANFRLSPAGVFLAEGQAVLAPMAHVIFCTSTGSGQMSRR